MNGPKITWYQSRVQCCRTHDGLALLRNLEPVSQHNLHLPRHLWTTFARHSLRVWDHFRSFGAFPSCHLGQMSNARCRSSVSIAEAERSGRHGIHTFSASLFPKIETWGRYPRPIWRTVVGWNEPELHSNLIAIESEELLPQTIWFLFLPFLRQEIPDLVMTVEESASIPLWQTVSLRIVGPISNYRNYPDRIRRVGQCYSSWISVVFMISVVPCSPQRYDLLRVP